MLRDIKNCKLDTVAEYLKLPPFNHHRACDDAKVLAEIFKILLVRLTEDTGTKEISAINTSLAGGDPKKLLPSTRLSWCRTRRACGICISSFPTPIWITSISVPGSPRASSWSTGKGCSSAAPAKLASCSGPSCVTSLGRSCVKSPPSMTIWKSSPWGITGLCSVTAPLPARKSSWTLTAPLCVWAKSSINP